MNSSFATLFPTVYESPDMKRILAVPIIRPPTRQQFEDFCRWHTLDPAYRAGWRYHPLQVQALCHWYSYGGMFGSIGLGHGKTLTAYKAADLSYQKGHRRILILTASGSYQQFMTKGQVFARERVPINLTVTGMGSDIPQRRRLAYANSKAPQIFVMPYTILQQEYGFDILQRINPTAFITDESHNLRDLKSARSRRVRDFIDKKSGERPPEFMVLSGTIADKSLGDIDHFFRWCLRENSPLPSAAREKSDWIAALDAGKNGDDYQSGYKTAQLRPLVNWANENFPPPKGEAGLQCTLTGVRAAFMMRLRSTPGVVVTDNLSSDVPIQIFTKEIRKPNDKLQAIISETKKLWVSPWGEQLASARDVYRVMLQLCSGFYYNLEWPTLQRLAQKQGTSEEEAAVTLENSMKFHDAKNDFRRELRLFFKQGFRHDMDTDRRVGTYFLKHGMKNAPPYAADLYEAWKLKRELDVSNKIKKEDFKYGVAVDDFKISAMVDWCRERSQGIIWYKNNYMGEWAAYALRQLRIPCKHYPSGSKSNTEILDKNLNKGHFLVCASGHLDGKELQYMNEAFFLQWYRNANKNEQCLGRMARYGQKSDCVTYTFPASIPFDHEIVAATINDAMYIEQNMGNPQLILSALWDPLPKYISAKVLSEKGFDPNPLNKQQLEKFKEIFSHERSE